MACDPSFLRRRHEVPTKELEHPSFCVVLRDSITAFGATTPGCGYVGPSIRDHVAGIVIRDVFVQNPKLRSRKRDMTMSDMRLDGQVVSCFPDKSRIGALIRSTGIAALWMSSRRSSQRRTYLPANQWWSLPRTGRMAAAAPGRPRRRRGCWSAARSNATELGRLCHTTALGTNATTARMRESTDASNNASSPPFETPAMPIRSGSSEL